jgi:hypothetical protein
VYLSGSFRRSWRGDRNQSLPETDATWYDSSAGASRNAARSAGASRHVIVVTVCPDQLYGPAAVPSILDSLETQLVVMAAAASATLAQGDLIQLRDDGDVAGAAAGLASDANNPAAWGHEELMKALEPLALPPDVLAKVAQVELTGGCRKRYDGHRAGVVQLCCCTFPRAHRSRCSVPHAQRTEAGAAHYQTAGARSVIEHTGCGHELGTANM